ncbi:hypothetical protein OsI_38095 [Oryza sativa Indica Group]|uniref:Uncharacterized protein n=1 Tax=Oryza sativa subsp. indica TaxID=39946 RepID=B8BPA7_ORYSI|nr:hypothetical protein OsI_38095 [Oryza sativa Indica Group]
MSLPPSSFSRYELAAIELQPPLPLSSYRHHLLRPDPTRRGHRVAVGGGSVELHRHRLKARYGEEWRGSGTR